MLILQILLTSCHFYNVIKVAVQLKVPSCTAEKTSQKIQKYPQSYKDSSAIWDLGQTFCHLSSIPCLGVSRPYSAFLCSHASSTPNCIIFLLKYKMCFLSCSFALYAFYTWTKPKLFSSFLCLIFSSWWSNSSISPLSNFFLIVQLMLFSTIIFSHSFLSGDFSESAWKFRKNRQKEMQVYH